MGFRVFLYAYSLPGRVTSPPPPNSRSEKSENFKFRIFSRLLFLGSPRPPPWDCPQPWVGGSRPSPGSCKEKCPPQDRCRVIIGEPHIGIHQTENNKNRIRKIQTGEVSFGSLDRRSAIGDSIDELQLEAD